MKRFISLGLFGLGVVILAGCPIYSDSSGGQRVCDQRSCYDCPNDYYSSDCSPISCGSSYDCPSGYACSTGGSCVAVGYPAPDSGVDGGFCSSPSQCAPGSNCGSDGTCHAGNCSTSGCPIGLTCKLSGGTAQCVGTPVPPTDGGVDGNTKPDAGPFTGCTADNDCPTPAGSLCLDGTCVAPPDQCTDGTQCTGGSQCVQGACTPTCDGSHLCPTGYSCDPKGVCTGNPKPCNDAPTSCAAGTTCAQDHCASPCGDGGTCANGLVCVQGGCVPNEKPQFTCAIEGTQDACASGSVCLHHSCYIACDPDAGDACKTSDQFNTCKTVQSSGGSYSVCGSSTNLGTDCDLTQGKTCSSGLICIDGFCR